MRTARSEGVARTSAAVAQSPPARPHHELAHTIGNAVTARSLRADREHAADAAGRRAETTPASADPLVTGRGTLSSAGRAYFEPIVGAPLDSAQVHLGVSSARLQARAATYGHHVFLPGQDFTAPGGRALLAHELAHVAQARSGPEQLLYKDPVEPHYPSEEEQRAIAKALQRDFPTQAPTPVPAQTPAQTPTPPAAKKDEPDVEYGRKLDVDQRVALIAKLRPAALAMVSREAAGSPPQRSSVSEADATAIAEKARASLQARFGAYVSVATFTRDASSTVASRRQAHQLQLEFAEGSNLIASVARTLIKTHFADGRELTDLDDDSQQAVAEGLRQAVVAERAAELRKITSSRVPGSYTHGQLRLFLRRDDPDLLETATHELVHSLAHPAFRAAFGDEDNINEAFTEYFARQASGGGDAYAAVLARLLEAKSAASGPAWSDQGEQFEESLREAYFRGRLDLIGWRPKNKAEHEAVTQAGGSGPWDAATAKTHELAGHKRLAAQQNAHRNLVGFGVYVPFQGGKPGAPSPSLRFARVFTRSEPAAQWQGLLEGTLVGPPITDPKSLGAALGIAVEYQTPSFYAGPGLRLTGRIGGAAGPEVDLTPFFTVGVRAWQRVRVGAEGFVVVPITAGKVLPGVGATVGIEF